MLFFLSAECAPLFAGGKKEGAVPKVERHIVVSSNKIRLDIDWSEVKNRSEYRYALYRGKEPLEDQNGEKAAPHNKDPIYNLVKEITAPPQDDNVLEENDDTVEAGYAYCYRVFWKAPEEPKKKFKAIINIDRLEDEILPKVKDYDPEPNYIDIHKAAEIKAAELVDSRVVELLLEWNEKIDQKEKLFGLYRADEEVGKKTPEKSTFHLIKELHKNDFQNESKNPVPEYRFKDAVPSGKEHYYRVFYLVRDDASDGIELPKQIALPLNTDNDSSVKAVAVILPPAPGIYAGIISFSGEAVDITKTSNDEGVETGALVPIDSFSRTDVLLQQFTTNYKLSANNGTALYYAFHKALINIADNIRERKLPANIKSINIITLTDGGDNASANPSLPDLESLNPKYEITRRDRLNNGYPAFLQSKLWPYENSNIEGIPLKAWAVNLSPDVSNQELKYVSNTQDNLQVVKTEDLKIFFGALAADLDNLNHRTMFSITLPSFYNGAEVTIKINDKGREDFIKGHVVFDENDDISFKIDSDNSTTNLYFDNSENPLPVKSIKTGNDYEYRFILDKTLSAGVDVTVLLYENDRWIENKNEFVKDFDYNPFIERESVLVYFVLDSSRSLINSIDAIRDAVKETIEELYRKNIGEGQKNENETANKSVYNIIPYEELPLPKRIFNQADFIRFLEENNNAAAWYQTEISNTKADENIQIWKINSGASPENDSAGSPSKIGEVSVIPSAAYGQRDLARLAAEEGGRLWIPFITNNIPFNLSGSGLEGFRVQIGAYKNLENAVKTLQILYDNNFSNVSIIKDDTGLYKVRLGPFNTRTEAAGALESIRGSQ